MALAAELLNSESTSGRTHHRLRKPGPTEKDVEIGKHIRARRTELGISQDALAREIGITYQQVQKYEAGANRVPSSRLDAISVALKCEVSFFFPPNRVRSDADIIRFAGNSVEALRLVRAFSLIIDQTARASIVALVELVSRCGLGNQ